MCVGGGGGGSGKSDNHIILYIKGSKQASWCFTPSQPHQGDLEREQKRKHEFGAVYDCMIKDK